jgi:hypothetical protein
MIEVAYFLRQKRMQMYSLVSAKLLSLIAELKDISTVEQVDDSIVHFQCVWFRQWFDVVACDKYFCVSILHRTCIEGKKVVCNIQWLMPRKQYVAVELSVYIVVVYRFEEESRNKNGFLYTEICVLCANI